MSVSLPLLFPPRKVTTPIDFSPYLRSIIVRTYSESPTSYSDEISILNRSRQDALTGTPGSDTTARDLLYKYFGQLEQLELRFPDLKVPFPWYVRLFSSVHSTDLTDPEAQQGRCVHIEIHLATVSRL